MKRALMWMWIGVAPMLALGAGPNLDEAFLDRIIKIASAERISTD